MVGFWLPEILRAAGEPCFLISVGAKAGQDLLESFRHPADVLGTEFVMATILSEVHLNFLRKSVIFTCQST